jgi:hypothetical protein
VRIRLRTHVRPIKAGVEARVPDIGLAAHGEDESEALTRLQKVAVTWCLGLRRSDRLERALTRRNIPWEGGGHDQIEVDLAVSSL